MSRFILTVALTCAAPAFADVRYFSAIDDLPIAPGLTETAERLEFTDDTARMIGLYAEGAAEAGQVRAFYDATLPQLGWALSLGSGGENETVYIRGREELALSFHQRGDRLLLQVQLFVRSPPRD